MNVRILSPALLAAALLLSACEQPAEPSGSAQPPAGPALVRDAPGLDGEFLRVQRQVPGFGGYFFDAHGDLTVYLTDPGQEGAARAVLAGVAARGPRAGATAIRVRRAAFDFRQLSEWHHQLGPVLGMEGVDFLDTDESVNRVRVGVLTDDAGDRVRAEAARLGLPREALVIERVRGGAPAATLRDRIRPTRGGTEIRNSTGLQCTLGFNVWYSNYKLGIPVGTRAFLTASHCSRTTFSMDGGVFSQGGTPIGYEIVDPRLFDSTTTTRCPAGRRCRWSDVSVVQYYDSVAWDLAYLAKTRWSINNPSTDYTIEINEYEPRLKIVGNSYPAVGGYVHKIGRTTGDTWGAVLRTCADYRWSETSTNLILCQTEVDAAVAGGDSGSPAYTEASSGTVGIAGIVWRETLNEQNQWGRRFVFSPVDQIKKDVVSFSAY